MGRLLAVGIAGYNLGASYSSPMSLVKKVCRRTFQSFRRRRTPWQRWGETHVAAPGLLQLGVLRCALAHQHLQTLHTEAPATACIAAEKQLTAPTALGAVGLVTIIVVHVEELKETIPACLAKPTLKEQVEGHWVFPTTGQTAIFQIVLVVGNIRNHLFSALIFLSPVLAIVIAVCLEALVWGTVVRGG